MIRQVSQLFLILIRSRRVVSLSMMALVLGIMSTLSVGQAHAASFSVSPSSQSFTQECVGSFDILINTEGVATNAADMFLNYNPAEVEILDQDASSPGVQIQDGSVYSIYAGSVVDEGSGQIRSTAFDVVGTFSGTGVYSTVFFRSRPGVTSTSFSFDFVNGSSTDSNIADSGGTDVLSSVSGGSFSFSPGFCTPDTQAPRVTTITPSDGGQDVPLNSNVSFTITDNQSGVDLETLSIQVHSTSYDRDSAEVSISGSPESYQVVVNPTSDFPTNTLITVLIRAEDVDGNAMSPYVIDFNAPDNQGPFVTGITPGNGAQDIPLDANVSLRVRDNDVGVDQSTVKITVDGVDYFATSSQVTVSGTPSNYLFEINPDEDFPELTEIFIVVEAADLVGNTMSPRTTSFNRPPAPAVCGNNVVEDGEECEPPGSLVCDDLCQITVDACLTEEFIEDLEEQAEDDEDDPVQSREETGVISAIVSTPVIEEVSNVLIDFGVVEQPAEVAGIELATVEVEPFVCQDELTEFAQFERRTIPYTPPEGFEVIREDIRFNCAGTLQTTVNISEEYYDVRAIKCVGGECADVQVSSAASISCGEELVFAEDETEAELAELEITTLQPQYNPGRYEVLAEPADSGREYAFRRFDGFSGGLLHSSLKVLTPPIAVRRESDASGTSEEQIRVTMPYVEDAQVSSSSVQLYALHPTKGEWTIIPNRTLLKDSVQVQATVDFNAYLNGDDEVVFAVMGTVCEDCKPSQFERVYAPAQPTRAAVVLVHDLMGDSGDWSSFVNDIRLSKQPWQVWSYGYDSSEHLTLVAKDLMASLQIYNEEYDVVYVVAHGIGGLVAQEALAYGHRENVITPRSFPVVSKVEKLMLIGTPSDVQESQPLILTYYNYLVNSGQGVLFNNDRLQELLKQRPHIPRVPGVEYFVVAGTQPPVDGLQLSVASAFSTAGVNDGLVTVSSAQKVGGQLVNDQCVNYWEVGTDHANLIQHPSARKVIGQLVSQDVGQAVRETALMGYQNFYQLADASCSEEDSYILIGRKVRREKAPDVLGCSCGNGFCGVDEDGVSCPQDCANVIRRENYPWLFLLAVLAVLVIGGSSLRAVRKKLKNSKKKSKKK